MRTLDRIPLLPCPRRVTRADGFLAATAGRALETDPSGAGFPLEVHADMPGLPAQGYRLIITPAHVRIEASGAAGAFYGRMTLRQLARLCPEAIPCGTIEDAPDILLRGVLLDISRDKVPTLATLFLLVEMLAEWKVNHLTLYMEHTFAYSNHRDVWAAACPLTAEEVRALDAYCRARFIELAPFQNSFGHFERWLKYPRYRPLAECPDGFARPDGSMREATTLDPTNPASLALIAELYAELLPNFTSQRLHIGGDETWELGRGRSRPEVERLGLGRVYFDYLGKLKELAAAHGRTALYFGDMVWNHFADQPGLMPSEMVHMDWGYYRAYPYREHGAKLAGAGVPFWFVPGTSTWCTLTGCNEAGIGSNRSAVQAGLEFGAGGILNTDWGDAGHWQTLPVSFIGFAAGAAIAWCEAGNTDEVIRAALDPHVFRDAAGVMGRAAYDLADTWMHVSENATASSHLHQILQDGFAGVLPGNVTPATLMAAETHLASAVDRMRGARMDRPDAALIVEEFAHNARMAMTACRMGRVLLAKDTNRTSRARFAIEFEAILAAHRRVWLARNRPGGLTDSLHMLELRLAECRV
ncbi:MAG: glycoside hydrolase family 20 zincin-like fold domain-containing protein [Kiritimatiellia bacterium]